MTSNKKSKKTKPVKQTVQRDAMSEGEAARAVASLFVREGGMLEGTDANEFEITDVSFDDDGEYFVMMKVRISNLDVETASTGDHLDQVKINDIRDEARSRDEAK